MKRIAILAALLIAVTAYGGNDLAWSGTGDVAIQSHDRVVVIALDTNGDGSIARSSPAWRRRWRKRSSSAGRMRRSS
jgi:hypothetical protein